MSDPLVTMVSAQLRQVEAMLCKCDECLEHAAQEIIATVEQYNTTTSTPEEDKYLDKKIYAPDYFLKGGL